MLLEIAARRRVLFVGGKGGVGKTSVASAVALAQARAGRRVLLVSTDPAHNLGHLWQRKIGDGVVRLAPGLDATEIDPAATADAHLRAVGRTVRALMPEHLAGEVDRHLALARDAPGTHEAAVLERIAQAVGSGLATHDLLVFDTAPSGHTARLMSLPEQMTAWTDGLLHRQDRSARFGAALRALDGPEEPGAQLLGGNRPGDRRAERDRQIRGILLRRRETFERLRAVLQDRTTTAFVIVLAGERLPALETVELHGQLRAAKVDVAALVVNKRSPAGQGDFLAGRRRQEQEHIDHVRSALPDVPVAELPLLAGDVVGVVGLERLGRLLARGQVRARNS